MNTAEFIWHLFLEAFVLSATGIFLWRWFRDSDHGPKELLIKLGITALAALIFWGMAMAFGARKYLAGEGNPVFALLPFVAVFCAIVLSFIWTPVLGGWLARPFTGAFDGGDEPPDPQPLYSMAKALAARGRFDESIAEIRRQFAAFPGDFEGMLMLAETQALSLHDLNGAEETIHELCLQKNRPPKQVYVALAAMADWHLKAAHDQAAARNCLQQIIGLYPDSEFSAAAAQRLAHLGDMRMALPAAKRNKFVVTAGIQNLGLREEKGLVKPRETPPGQQAEELVQQITQHPLDTEAREKLAELYVQHYGRLDLAIEQLETLLRLPNQPGRNVARWLNQLADLQVRHGGDHEAPRQTLQRIVDAFPGLAAAQLARGRMELLRLEMKSKEKSQAVKLGSYEQNIGLKHGLPRRQQ